MSNRTIADIAATAALKWPERPTDGDILRILCEVALAAYRRGGVDALRDVLPQGT